MNLCPQKGVTVSWGGVWTCERLWLSMVSAVVVGWESTLVKNEGMNLTLSFMAGKVSAKLGSEGLTGSWCDSEGMG